MPTEPSACQLSLRPRFGDEAWDAWVRWQPEQLEFPFVAHLSPARLPSHLGSDELAWDCFLRIFCEDPSVGDRGGYALEAAGRWSVYLALVEQQRAREAWAAQRWRYSIEGIACAATMGCRPPGDHDAAWSTQGDWPAERRLPFAGRVGYGPSSGEIALQAWIAGVEEFLVMTTAAKRGLKRLCDGRMDDEDREAYDEEAVGCRLALEVLRKLALPEYATGGEARFWALQVLAQAGRELRSYNVGLTWAEAVVDGDSERYQNAYHPQQRRRLREERELARPVPKVKVGDFVRLESGRRWLVTAIYPDGNGYIEWEGDGLNYSTPFGWKDKEPDIGPVTEAEEALRAEVMKRKERIEEAARKKFLEEEERHAWRSTS